MVRVAGPPVPSLTGARASALAGRGGISVPRKEIIVTRAIGAATRRVFVRLMASSPSSGWIDTLCCRLSAGVTDALEIGRAEFRQAVALGGRFRSRHLARERYLAA